MARRGAAGQDPHTHRQRGKNIRRGGRNTETRNASPGCGASSGIAAKAWPPCAGVRTATPRTHVHLQELITTHWRAPVKGGRRRLDLGAGVRGHRHRILLTAQNISAQRPKLWTQGTTHARCIARWRGAGKSLVLPARQRGSQP
jgi:hypothetical protein